MTPGQRHAVLATAALVPALIYEAVEVEQGPDGWPYSRFLRLLHPAVFLAGVAGVAGWLIPHILRRAAQAVDDALAPLDTDQEC